MQVAKKYRIVAMITLRRQADFSRDSTHFELFASERNEALAADRATT